MKVEVLEGYTPGINPFIEDIYHMGTQIGKNVMVMYEKFSTDRHHYIIVVNVDTGERLRIVLMPDEG